MQVSCNSGALRERAKSLARQLRANRDGDYSDGLVAANAGRCSPSEGMQRLLIGQPFSTAGSILPCRGSWQLYPARAVPCRKGPVRFGDAPTEDSAPRKRDSSSR